MRHVEERTVRFALFEAHSTRASDRGPLAGQSDNGPILEDILALRHEQARLLGFRSHADVLAACEVGSADNLERLLLERNAVVRPGALQELDRAFALSKASGGAKGFRPWDLAYYAEKLELPPGCGLATVASIERELFDLRVHRDYVPADKSSKLRSHVFDTLAQVRREVSVLAWPPWDRSANSFVDLFADGADGPDGAGARAATITAAVARAGHAVHLHAEE
jgi:Zn-dependent oligopeptidase